MGLFLQLQRLLWLRTHCRTTSTRQVLLLLLPLLVLSPLLDLCLTNLFSQDHSRSDQVTKCLLKSNLWEMLVWHFHRSDVLPVVQPTVSKPFHQDNEQQIQLCAPHSRASLTKNTAHWFSRHGRLSVRKSTVHCYCSKQKRLSTLKPSDERLSSEYWECRQSVSLTRVLQPSHRVWGFTEDLACWVCSRKDQMLIC